MSEATDILSLEEAEAAINMVGNSANHAAQLELWVSAISEAIDAKCGPVVIRTITGEEHDAAGPIFLKRWPVASVTTVTEYASGVGTVLTAEDLDTSGGYLLRSGGILDRRSGFTTSTWTGRIAVTYTAGRYASTAVVGAKWKLTAGAILRRLWAREGAAWSRGGDVFAGDTGPGFFRAIDPMVTEFLGDELLPPAVA